jgi:pimeloyl-ACP methyl ester carboxylesterase
MSFSEEMKAFEKAYPYQKIQVGRACFRYILAGPAQGPAVVLLNGGMNCSEMWHAYVQALSRSCRVLAFDYPRELATAEETVDAIAQLMETLGIDRAVLAGASFGGLMAQLITKRYPQKVRGLGLFSTAALTEATIQTGRKKYRGYKLLLWVMKRKHLNYEKLKPKLIAVSMKQTEQESEENRQYIQEMLAYLFKDYPKEKDIHITGLMVGLMKTEPCHKEEFAYLNGNVAMMFPEKDFFSKEEQQELINTFPGARIEYVKNGHFGTILEWERYVDVIKGLL